MRVVGAASSFQERSYDIARAFLHTVVVVDDQAEIYGSYATVVPMEITEPDQTESIDLNADERSEIYLEQGSASEVDSSQEAGSRVHTKDSAHDLDAKALVDAFADHDIVCSILCPVTKDEPLDKRVIGTARRADLIVLDWIIDGDDGDRTLGIITEILAIDRGRLRLIAIYTAQPDIGHIAERLATLALDGKVLSWSRINAYTLVYDATRLVIFTKKQEPDTLEDDLVIPDLTGRQTTPTELPSKLIAEFAEAANGLVPNFALRCLAVLRSTTYPILQNLHRGLDEPYITHRTLLSNPDDAQEHLLSLIVGEVSAVLEQSVVSEEAGRDAVASWWEATKSRRPSPFKVLNLGEDDTYAFLVNSRLPSGQQSLDTLQTKIAKELTSKLRNQDHPAATAKDPADQEYAMRMMLRTRYVDDQHLPILHLGTIIKKEEDGTFWLCMQPLCDSVRLRTCTAFPLLPLQIMTATKDTDVIVRSDDGTYCHLQVRTAPSQCCMVLFDPDREKRVVQASRNEDAAVFFAATGQRYRWIAELRPEQAQRWASEYAAKLSRVGVDQSEWLRRVSK
jgi:hypothetical protein